jgi:hypothetical protein
MSQEKRPLAFLLGISANLGFAAGNVALSLNKYMGSEAFDILIYYSSLHEHDRIALGKIPHVHLVPFQLDATFIELMLSRLPPTSRFRNADSLMCFCHFEAFALLDRYKTVVWLDADVAIQGSLSGINEFKPIGITADSPWPVRGNFTEAVPGYNMDRPGWCSAVMVVQDDLPHADLYRWCYDKAAEYAPILVNPDQGIINLAFEHFRITPSEMPLEVWQCVPWREQARTARITHFGTDRKVWSDPNVFAAFPEWYRTHLEWLELGGGDFSRWRTPPKNPLDALDALDKLTLTGSRRWSAPVAAGEPPRQINPVGHMARKLYLRLKLHNAPDGSVRNAVHGLAKAILMYGRARARRVTTPRIDRPDIAFRLRGGLGDHLIAARYIRDLCAATGGLRFDLYSSRPELAAWVFQHIPTANVIYNEHMEWDLSLSEYSLPVHLQQFVHLYLDRTDCRQALNNNPGLGRICEAIERNRHFIERHIVEQPFSDSLLARQAVLRGWNRYNIAHNMSGLAYGGDRLPLDVAPGVLAKYDLTSRPYVTIHNASDENFMIGALRMGDRQSTKLYPHFARVVELLHDRFPGLYVVHLGGSNSRSIAGVDLDLRGRCTIQESAAILSRSCLHIDVESGMVHLAASLGVRSAVLFGPTNLEYFAYDGNINIPPATCGDCWWMNQDWMLNCAKGYALPKCLDDIPPERVVKALSASVEKIWGAASGDQATIQDATGEFRQSHSVA